MSNFFDTPDPSQTAAGARESTARSVLDALRDVIDPEIGLDVVTLGLIYDVDVTETTVEVTYTLTTPGCPLAEYMRNAIQYAAERAAADRLVATHLVFDPLWTPDRIQEVSC